MQVKGGEVSAQRGHAHREIAGIERGNGLATQERLAQAAIGIRQRGQNLGYIRCEVMASNVAARCGQSLSNRIRHLPLGRGPQAPPEWQAMRYRRGASLHFQAQLPPDCLRMPIARSARPGRTSRASGICSAAQFERSDVIYRPCNILLPWPTKAARRGACRILVRAGAQSALELVSDWRSTRVRAAIQLALDRAEGAASVQDPPGTRDAAVLYEFLGWSIIPM